MKGKYYHTKESVEEYLELAKDVGGVELIRAFKKHLPADSTLLELGSGPGTDWRILSETYMVTGSDISEEFLEYLRGQNPKGEFLKVSAESILTDTSFDGMYSNKVLQHLTDQELRASVESQYRVLNKGGLICHSFWYGEGTEVFKGMLVNYHDAEGLTDFFGQHFELLEMKRYKEFEDGDSIVLIGRKK
jgi:ubiquinone/menaquinone biosynthesis C-methylase UbiE